MADVAAAMRRRGWDVVVVAGARDFDDPSKSYRSAQLPDGTRVIRVPFSSFGKATLARRGHKARKVIRGLRDRRVRKATPARRGHRAIPGRRGHRATRVRRARKGPRARPAKPD